MDKFNWELFSQDTANEHLMKNKYNIICLDFISAG